ncbi:MAG TPA: hypothetical protein VF498_13850 [Anaerolineales bacterium]
MRFIPILSTIVTFAFAAAVFNRYQYKKGNHLLMWGIGLILYGLGTLTEVILGFTFSSLALKIWYLSGAMLTAAWLGQGTIFLLIRRRGVAPALTVVLALISLLAIGMVLAAPITQAAATFDVAKPVSMQYRDILTRGGLVILLTIVLNIYGTIALVGGAAYSAYLFWRKRVLASRVLGNILIALGALMPAMAGSLVKAGLADWLYVSELLGAVIMYIGFIQSTSTNPVEQKAAVPSAARTVK